VTVSDETWKPIPGYGGYEASDMGRIRSIDRTLADGRRLRGQLLKPRKGNRGYMTVKVTDDAGHKQTRTVHRLVLMTFTGPCPEGQETRHGPGGQLDNRLANLCYGTPAENAADKSVNGGGEPSFPCRNAPACGNMVMNEGRRCKDCVTKAARRAAEWLGKYKMSLDEVTRRLDYENSDWVYRIARELGGYEGTKREARQQQPGLSQRVAITVRDRRRGGWSDAA
jgi:hypothetical protein